MSEESPQTFVNAIFARDRRAIARAATLLENGHAGTWYAEIVKHGGRAKLVGVTGPPGAGKSTFCERLVRVIRGQGMSVAIVAVDPSSHQSGGALLGDRIRMQHHAGDEGVFIRSMATRGEVGGLAKASERLVKLFDAAGFDVVLIETVGVGQAEIDVARLAACVLLVMAPGQGDSVQALKAGVMEIADIFVVNKADYQMAEKLYQDLMGEVEGRAPVLKTVAAKGDGMPEVWAQVEKYFAVHSAWQPKLARYRTEFGIDHLGIAVASIEEALHFYRDALGMRIEHRETVAAERVHTAMLPAGESRIELLEAMDPESTIAKFIAKRGAGLHHVAIRVRDLEGTAKRLKEQGGRILNEPRIGAGGHRYVFVHPASTGGVLLELIEEQF